MFTRKSMEVRARIVRVVLRTLLSRRNSRVGMRGHMRKLFKYFNSLSNKKRIRRKEMSLRDAGTRETKRK